MSEKRRNGKKDARPAKPDSGVLAGLSSTRPSRLSRRGSTDADASAEAKSAATRSAAASARRAATTRKPAKPTAAKAAPEAARPAAVEEAPPPVNPAAVNVTADEVAAKAQPRPRAVRAASSSLSEPIAEAAARRDVQAPEAQRSSPGPAELATTVVQAAGELAQIGLTVGGQILKRAAQKLPKP